MLLIHPPIAKPCEPPAGISRLAGALRAHGIPCRLLDANLEGQLHLLEHAGEPADTWTRRAAKNRTGNLAALRDPGTYGSPDRYNRAVRDLNRLMSFAGREKGTVPGLADYRQPHLSPLRSSDLLAAAEQHARNPFFRYFHRRLPEVVEDGGLVGISLNYLSQALCTFAMIGYLRERFAGLTIVLGGGLVTSWLARPGWTSPFAGLVDRLVAGPGEKALLALCGADAGGDLHGTPAYDLLPLADYLAPGVILPYSAAGGCYWNRCSFCPERVEGNGYSPLPVPRAVAELQGLSARMAPALIHLLDNAVNPSLLRALADNPPGAPWYGFARIDEQLTDLDFCRALRRSGCVMLKLGLESGDQGVLDRLGKGIDLGTASRALESLGKAGIAVYCYLLFGTPAETETEARQTLEFVVRHREAIRFLNLALFNMPVAGDEAELYGTAPFYEGDLSLYTAFRHPRGWDRKRVRSFLANEFTRHPAVAAILRNDPPVFTSNHAPFFAAPPGPC